jgi:hypothetical protein
MPDYCPQKGDKEDCGAFPHHLHQYDTTKDGNLIGKHWNDFENY